MTLTRGQLIGTIVAVVLALALLVRACSGGEDATPPPPVAQQPTTATVAPTQDSEAVTRVPGGRASGSSGRGDGRPRPSNVRVPRDRLATLPGGVDAVAEQVDWTDRRQVASRTVRAATIIATLYGREIGPTTAELRPMMNRQALMTVRATMSIDPPPASMAPARVRVVAANLRTDPETGIRTGEVQVSYPDAPSSQANALITLQFATSAPTIVGWKIQPD